MPVTSKIRSIFFFSFLLISFQIYPQNRKMNVSGTVLDLKTSRPIPHCYIEVQLADTIIRQKVDTAGKFFVAFSSDLLRSGSIILNAWQERSEIITERKLKIKCKDIINYGGYLKSSEKMEIKDSAASVFTFEITLKPTESGISFPLFIFEKNTLKFAKFGKGIIDTSLFCFKEALDINPGLVVEIAGYAFEEKNAGEISLERASLIKKRLEKMGINSDRLIVRSYGENKPKWSKEDIMTIADMKKREQMVIMNRRVEFKIISFDFNRKKSD